MDIEWSSEKDYEYVFKLAEKNSVTARRMNAIDSAKNFRDLEPGAHGRAHFLKGNYKGFFALDLKTKTNPERLICKPIGDFERYENGNFIKKTITKFRVIKIEKNYH